MRTLATCASLALILSAAVSAPYRLAHASPPRLSQAAAHDAPRPDRKIKEFDSIEEAAIAALTGAYAFSHYYEVGGVITQMPDGKFAVGMPFSQWSGREVQIDYDPDIYTGKIVGDYHQHPCNTNHFIPGQYSDADLGEYRTYHVTGFLLDMCTGEVHEFVPGVDKSAGPMGETFGRIVGKIPVDGKVTDTAYAVID